MTDPSEGSRTGPTGGGTPPRPEYLSAVLALLAEVFLEPEGDIKVRLQDLLSVGPGEREADDGLIRPLTAMVHECPTAREQAVEFVRLFLHGPNGATVHPYESVQLRGTLMAPECVDDLRALHEAAGVRPRAGSKVPPDHLGLELDFLAYLLGHASEGSEVEREKFRGLAGRLLRDHLRPFTEGFTGQLAKAQPHPYFAAAGEALTGLIETCAACLERSSVTKEEHP